MPRDAATDITGLLQRYAFTDNKGNMLHGEAPTRLFSCDRERSCYVSVQALDEAGWDSERISAELSRHFDLVVYSTANAIRPGVDPGCTARVLDGLSIDFMVLGMGLQDAVQDKTRLHPNLLQLLEVCDRKAVVFGVRGDSTEQWLHAAGYRRATALGCPSLYVYPRNVMRLRPPRLAADMTVVTGGYISARTRRSSALIALMRGHEAHYVMQDEVAIWAAQGLLDRGADCYDDATGEFNRETAENILARIHDEAMPFSSYRWFQSPGSWRAFTSRFDVSVSDRLHGSVAALQSGVPSLIVADDLRVREIAAFFEMPCASLDDIENASLHDLAAEHFSGAALSRLQTRYAERFDTFKRAMAAADVTLTVACNDRPSRLPQSVLPVKRSTRQLVTSKIRRILRRF